MYIYCFRSVIGNIHYPYCCKKTQEKSYMFYLNSGIHFVCYFQQNYGNGEEKLRPKYSLALIAIWDVKKWQGQDFQKSNKKGKEFQILFENWKFHNILRFFTAHMPLLKYFRITITLTLNERSIELRLWIDVSSQKLDLVETFKTKCWILPNNVNFK